MIGMHKLSRRAGWALAVVIVLGATRVAAQSPGAPGSLDDSAGQGRRMHRGGQSTQQQRPAPLPEVKVTPDPWPRLDPGAVFCQTSEDLRQHLAVMAARLDGNGGGPGEPAGCRLVRAATPVTVVVREGPGRTQVRLSGAAAETGWTDAFLPDKQGRP